MVKYFTVDKRDKESGYIPIGAAVTSYSRAFTITAAQNNYKYFNYSDTDSIHVNCDIKDVKGVKIHDSNLNAWKVENKWDVAFFHRQKTYIEIDGDIQYLKCAGMPERCKLLFLKSCGFEKNVENLTDEEAEAWDALNLDSLNRYDLDLDEANRLLDEDGWRDLRSMADYTIFIRADEELLRKRLIDRRIETGTAREPAIRFVDFSDMPNVRLCLSKTLPADLELQTDADGDYRLIKGDIE